jgi:fatty-acyl-CoA synthase
MPRIERSGDDLYILYTGGTTGMPKGVMWRNEDLYETLVPAVLGLAGVTPPTSPEGLADVVAEVAAAGRTPVHLPASPLMHGTGFMSSLQALTAGGALVTLESRSFDAHELWKAVEREHVTQMAIVGDAFGKPMVRALEEAETDNAPYDLTSLGLIISSGVMWTAPVKEALMTRAGCICLDSLGSSEGVGFAQQISAPGVEATTAKFSIGANCKVLTEDGREVAPGSDERGLLALGGPIPLGYYKDPEKSAGTFKVFAGKRYSIPGDWARVAADGTIELLGRGSVSINSGGEKVFPEEVEEILKTHPAVHDSVVVGLPDEKFGEAITAVVEPMPGAELDEDDLIAHVKGKLASFKAPKTIVAIDTIGRAPNGKVDYKRMKGYAADQLGVDLPS